MRAPGCLMSHGVRREMAGQRNVLSTLRAYAGDSDSDSDTETDTKGLVSAGYGDDDISRVEEVDELDEEDESSSPLEGEDSEKELPELDGVKAAGYSPASPRPYLPMTLPTDTTAQNSAVSSDHIGLLLSFKLIEDHPYVIILSANESVCQDPTSEEFLDVEKKNPQELVASFSEKVRNMSPDDIKIPPEPMGRCSNHLQEKILKLYDRKLNEGLDMNNIIQRKKEFRNPSIYEKLIQFCGIDELGTNYPKDMFDPHGWSEDSYYEALAKAQKIEMDKIEKAKKERTKIEFVTRTKTGTNTSSGTATTATASTTMADSQKRKSKWDSAVPVTTIAQPTIITTTATLPGVVTVTTSATGAKTTVISAVGTIVKKAKQ